MKVPDLRRMSALLEIRPPKDVKEQMMTRLDENGENYENIKAKVWCRTRPTRPSKHEEGRKRRKCRWTWTT